MSPPFIFIIEDIGIMKGIIYKWTCNLSGKSYIGQTVNEKRREKDFLTEGTYAGDKIDNARKKYGLSQDVWTKEVLKRLWCKDGKEDSLRERLNYWERYYIELYDTVKNGYNTTNGGDCDFSEEVIDEMRRKGRENWEKLCDEEKNNLIRKSRLGYNRWRSSISDEEFREMVVKMAEVHTGHAVGRSIQSSKLNKGRKIPEKLKNHLSNINKGKKQGGCKVYKYSEGKTKLIETYNSITDASSSIGVKPETLSKWKNRNYKGFYWEIEKSQEIKGYKWKKRLNRWNANIKYKGKYYDLGCFKYEEAAHEMYLIAKKKIAEGVFEDWEANHKFNDKVKLYEKYGEKMINMA